MTTTTLPTCVCVCVCRKTHTLSSSSRSRTSCYIWGPCPGQKNWSGTGRETPIRLLDKRLWRRAIESHCSIRSANNKKVVWNGFPYNDVNFVHSKSLDGSIFGRIVFCLGFQRPGSHGYLLKTVETNKHEPERTGMERGGTKNQSTTRSIPSPQSNPRGANWLSSGPSKVSTSLPDHWDPYRFLVFVFFLFKWKLGTRLVRSPNSFNDVTFLVGNFRVEEDRSMIGHHGIHGETKTFVWW